MRKSCGRADELPNTHHVSRIMFHTSFVYNSTTDAGNNQAFLPLRHLRVCAIIAAL